MNIVSVAISLAIVLGMTNVLGASTAVPRARQLEIHIGVGATGIHYQNRKIVNSYYQVGKHRNPEDIRVEKSVHIYAKDHQALIEIVEQFDMSGFINEKGKHINDEVEDTFVTKYGPLNVNIKIEGVDSTVKEYNFTDIVISKGMTIWKLKESLFVKVKQLTELRNE